MEPGSLILLIIAAVVVVVLVATVGTLVFGGWVIVSFLRLLARAIGAGGANSSPAPALPGTLARCEHGNCRAANAPAARFCRRCGRPVSARRAPRAAA